MKTDITLENEDNILIIDAKYYIKTMQENYNIKKITFWTLIPNIYLCKK